MWILSLALFSVTRLVFREKCESKCVHRVNAGWKSRSIYFEACLAIFRDFSSGFTFFYEINKKASAFYFHIKTSTQFFYSSSFYFLCWILLYLFGYVAASDCVWISVGCFHTMSSLYDLILPTQNSFDVTGKYIHLGAFAFWNTGWIFLFWNTGCFAFFYVFN